MNMVKDTCDRARVKENIGQKKYLCQSKVTELKNGKKKEEYTCARARVMNPKMPSLPTTLNKMITLQYVPKQINLNLSF